MAEMRNGGCYHLWVEGCPRTYRKGLWEQEPHLKILENVPDIPIAPNIDKYSTMNEIAKYLEAQGSTPVYVQLGGRTISFRYKKFPLLA